MQKTFLLILCLYIFSIQLQAQHTFSIIAVDPDTGEIGSAGASCVDGAAQLGGVHIINEIIPNRGGINAQAWICVSPHINLENGIDQMEDGLSPDEIIQYLTENDACSAQGFNPEFRQYGIVDFSENGETRSAAFTGNSADDYKGHILGPNYAIQGNILLGPEILEEMEKGFLETTGSLADKLMAAMQGANVAGADARCLDRETSSTSAYLKVARPDNLINDPFLFLNIPEMPFGVEPIDSLQVLYQDWLTSSINETLWSHKIQCYPNPSNSKINLESDNDLKFNNIDIFNNYGLKVKSLSYSQKLTINSLDISDLEMGVYIINIKNGDQLIGVKKVIKI